MEARDVAPGPIIEPRWLDVDTAAQYLCMSRHALYHRVSRRQIPFVRSGRIVRFDRQALDRWMSKGVRNGFGEAGRDLVFHEADQRPAVSRVHGQDHQDVRRNLRRSNTSEAQGQDGGLWFTIEECRSP